MVLRRRSEYGFVGYDAPVIPRARRSIRKKGSCNKAFGEGQLCAFELLATVAGKLLQEAEISSASSSAAEGLDHIKDQLIKQEVKEPVRTEQDDQGSSEESVVSSGLRLLKYTQKDANKGILKSASTVDSSACSMKMGCSGVKSATDKSEDEFVQIPSKIDGGSPKFGESPGANVDNEITTAVGEGDGGLDGEVFAEGNESRPRDSIVRLCGKSPPQINSNDDANTLFEQLPLGRGSFISDASFVRHRNDLKIGRSRDNNEILSQCPDPSSGHLKACQSTTPVGDRGISKMLTSKYWKSGPELKDCEVTNSGSRVNNLHRNKKSLHFHERFWHHDAPFKKRKLFGQNSVVTHDAGVSGESVSKLTEKGIFDNKSCSPMLKPHRDKGVLSPTMDRQRSFTSRSSQVKLSIKSFIVPELLIEVPESTSVGSLKKSIVEAVTTVYGGGLRVGLLLNGKRIHDDGRTLLQTGLSDEDTLNNLGFLLDPSSPTALPSSTPFPKVSPILPTNDSPKDFVNSPFSTLNEELNLLDALGKTSLTGSVKVAGSNSQDLVLLAPHSKPEKKPASDSRALVAVQENTDSLAVIPTSRRPRPSEIGQRRTRRPFSVSEVEALVQAVEKLGTGRWRDVKLCAFENVKHRTYVDLKDKWKTLVHTARIFPQQRRGEPVPQELLDRVLAAHAYWSQHQAKQHGKQQHQHHNHHQAPIPVEKAAAA